MKLTFYGGVKSVTGANYVVESGDTRLMIDCGLQQGSYAAEEENWNPFPYKPADIDALLVTHSHIDHIGRIPLLVKKGFSGVIYSTPPTKEAGHLLLLDSEHLLENTAKDLKKLPLYGPEDVMRAMSRWETLEYYHPITIGPFTITFYNTAHILGSSYILVEETETKKRIVFSGDLGNSPAPLLGDKDSLVEADYCVIESAYGNRLHEDREERRGLLEDAIEDTVKKKGVLMIPAFAMERTQELLSEIDQLADGGRIPHVPVFIDSPLAIKLTAVYRNHSHYLKNGNGFDFTFHGLQMTETTLQSKAINDVPSPKVIIAGSGMSNGGRILHHERRYLSDPNNMFLVIGYQAHGSLGREIVDGAKEVTIFGERILVRCAVRQIEGYSAHADQKQLVGWLKPRRDMLKNVFVVQGEEEESAGLYQKIRDELAVDAEIPEAGKEYEL